MACVVLKPEFEGKVGAKELLAFLSERVAKWWLPDDVVFVDALPIGATGKVLKNQIRESFKDYKLPDA